MGFRELPEEQKCNKSGTKNSLFLYQKCIKTVPKTGLIVQAKAQQNASSFGGESMASSWEGVNAHFTGKVMVRVDCRIIYD